MEHKIKHNKPILRDPLDSENAKEMQKKIEVLGSALKKTLLKLNALEQYTQGILTSFQTI